MRIEDIARIAHEVNRGYCRSIGDLSHLPWDEAPEWQRESTRAGVHALLADPGRTPAESHLAWMDYKIRQGWVYGPVKDETAKTHPCLLPYGELSEAHRMKDRFFCAVVRICGPLLNEVAIANAL